MHPVEPSLQRKLLAWLLGPLLLLLVLDTAFTYWSSVNYSNLAHDRSLHEIAREVVLHVKPNGSGPRLDLSPAAERILLVDQDDRVFYKVTSGQGAVIGGDPQLPRAPGLAGGKRQAGVLRRHPARRAGARDRLPDVVRRRQRQPAPCSCRSPRR